MIDIINQNADEDEQCDRSKYIRYLLRRDLKQMRERGKTATTQRRSEQTTGEDDFYASLL
jgi:Arc/MetJ-type ribon-helix-helix transcriptional regulator